MKMGFQKVVTAIFIKGGEIPQYIKKEVLMMLHGDYFTIYKEFRILINILFYIVMSILIFNIFTISNKLETKEQIKIIVSFGLCFLLVILY